MINNKAVLITGAYGGMGKATAAALSKRGYKVFALDKEAGEGSDNIIPVKADITDEKSVRSAFMEVSRQTDGLVALIHFAGIYMLDSLVEMEREAFDCIFHINVRGAYLINKEFLPLLSKGGRIIITTSELAPLDPLPFTGIYAVTKAALDKYAYSLRMELQLRGIDVTVLRAGAVTTGMLGASTDALSRFCEKTRLYTCNADRFRRIVEGVEARSISPSKVAAKIEKIMKKKRTAFAYSINRNPLLLMLNNLPRSLQLWVIKQILK